MTLARHAAPPPDASDLDHDTHIRTATKQEALDAVEAHLHAKNEQIADYRKQLMESYFCTSRGKASSGPDRLATIPSRKLREQWRGTNC